MSEEKKYPPGLDDLFDLIFDPSADAGVELIKRLEPVFKDAARYRWLRQSSAGTIRLDGNPDDFRWACPQYLYWGGQGVTLDAAVDAAMAETPAVGAA